jgi:hypothetical protein
MVAAGINRETERKSFSGILLRYYEMGHNCVVHLSVEKMTCASGRRELLPNKRHRSLDTNIAVQWARSRTRIKRCNLAIGLTILL